MNEFKRIVCSACPDTVCRQISAEVSTKITYAPSSFTIKRENIEKCLTFFEKQPIIWRNAEKWFKAR